MIRRFLACASVMLIADEARACATCFGDPDSAMAKGAVMGVLVLLGITSAVLLGVAGTGLFWIQRSRRLQHQEDGAEPADA